ncbi:MAG: lyase family protein [bacterium]|nr:argininosuccinate lyase [Planctomycetota bacterium]HIL52510.1 argininosuccinate lyase [Planctomycetota bacterium]
MSHDEIRPFHPPVWDRGEEIDAQMMQFTIGDDWRHDQRLVEQDIRGSLAHVDGLLEAELISSADHGALHSGLRELLASWSRGEWTVEAGDEDVHSAVERRLTAAIGEAGERLHTGRSRNDQIALDMRLWLRDALALSQASLAQLEEAFAGLAERQGGLPLPGYTHLRRAMPSSVGDWLAAHRLAFATSAQELAAASLRLKHCPLGSGAGYGVPLPLARDCVARALGFEGPEEPVTAAQLFRGRAELAYLNALESVGLDLEKLACDLWLYTSEEFGFVDLPVELTTGSSLMPHKRNPDLIELLRGHGRQLGADRDSLRAVIAGLPSGYHRDFQLLKAPLFRAHDRSQAALALTARLIEGLRFKPDALETAALDPALEVTRKALEATQAGMSFRAAYRQSSRSQGSPPASLD